MQNTSKYLFLDSNVIDGHNSSNIKLHVNTIKKDKENNPLFREEFFASNPKEWEVRYDIAYPYVFNAGHAGIYRCYYILFLKDDDSASTPLHERPGKQYQPSSTRVTGFCYAFSKDGINWEKPNLGIVEFNGNTNNNIIMRNA